MEVVVTAPLYGANPSVVIWNGVRALACRNPSTNTSVVLVIAPTHRDIEDQFAGAERR